MLSRFSLYGFLKNQQYFDYSLVLAFLEMGLSYAQIGLLIGSRAVVVAALEIPSGVIADHTGRRRAMVLSMAAYVMSFATLGGLGIAAKAGVIAGGALYASLFGAMALFAVGEAFRSGTHKAMIFAWLRAHGRTAERTRVYGITRSWSKLGSALSTIIACTIIFFTGDFITVFLVAIIPYLLNIVNVATYPPEVESTISDGLAADETTPLKLKLLARELVSSLREAYRAPRLRRVLAEAMGFESFFKAAKDYLQPILLAGALALTAQWLPAGSHINDAQRSIVLLGPVYVVIFLVSAAASRNAHHLVTWAGGSPMRAGRILWLGLALTTTLLLAALLAGSVPAVVLGFVCLYILQNVWRTLLMSRLDAVSDARRGATVLSIESQLKSIGVLILAPILGALVDSAPTPEGGLSFWPVAAVGFVIAGFFLATGRRAQA